jgi:membrane protein YqaA with SNARE-associated domain
VIEAYLGLFAAALMAATLLPAHSEVVLGVLITQGFSPLPLWIVATSGNTLGAVVNWILGRFFLRYTDRRWFPLKRSQLARAQHWYERYGVWSLLFAWLPVIGDGFTLIAGVMRTPFVVFVVLTATGKGARYAVIIWLAQMI